MVARCFPAETRMSQPQGGNVLWIEMPKNCQGIDIFNRALEKEIGIIPGILFSSTRRFKNCIRINCGHPWNDINEAAISTLGEIVTERAQQG